ncbi:MAG TPA: transposase [Chloroflexia bacterium]|nr:transposase [Chloroflexia bacterium]
MKGRIFTPEFKLNAVKTVLSGEKKVVELCRELCVSDNTIHNWKKLYLEKGEEAFTSSYSTARQAKSELNPEEEEIRALRQKVAELERFIGQQAVDLSI